jgi:hypothetical protein
VKLSTLVPTDISVHYISIEESILFSLEDGGKCKIIQPVRPAQIYLTPNLPADPGFSVDAVKILTSNSGNEEIFYQRGGRRWENWEPGKRLS